MRRRHSSPGSSHLLAGTLLLVAAVSARASAQDPPRFTERVDVARILLDVRAIDPRGRPLLGLEASDFEVKIDGKVARVESVQRVTAEAAVAPDPASTSPTLTTPVAPVTHGRLVVFLFQKSLDKSTLR